MSGDNVIEFPKSGAVSFEQFVEDAKKKGGLNIPPTRGFKNSAELWDAISALAGNSIHKTRISSSDEIPRNRPAALNPGGSK